CPRRRQRTALRYSGYPSTAHYDSSRCSGSKYGAIWTWSRGWREIAGQLQLRGSEGPAPRTGATEMSTLVMISLAAKNSTPGRNRGICILTGISWASALSSGFLRGLWTKGTARPCSVNVWIGLRGPFTPVALQGVVQR